MKVMIEYTSEDPKVNIKLVSALVQTLEDEKALLKNISFQEESAAELQIPDFINQRSGRCSKPKQRIL